MPNDRSNLLKVEKLFKRFDNVSVLEDVNLSIVSQSIFALLGPNGAGKTTLLKIISGLIDFDSGFIFLNRDQVHSQKYIENIGYCPQSPLFWKNLTCLEQLLFNADLFRIPKSISKSRAIFLFEKLGLLGKKDVKVENLSGGFQKRLNLAMALINSPKILILDEPTANLDQESKLFVRELLLFLTKEEGITILYTTHDLEEINTIATDIAIMRQGHITYQGKIENPSNINSLYEIYMSYSSSHLNI